MSEFNFYWNKNPTNIYKQSSSSSSFFLCSYHVSCLSFAFLVNKLNEIYFIYFLDDNKMEHKTTTFDSITFEDL